MPVDLNYSVTFWLYGPHPAVHIYASCIMQEEASEKELQPFQPLLIVQPKKHWRPLLCLTTLLMKYLRSSLCDKAEVKGKSWAVDPFDTFRGSAIEEEVAQSDHSASEHANTLIALLIIFVMLKAKPRLMYLVRWEPYVISEVRTLGCFYKPSRRNCHASHVSTGFLWTEAEIIKIWLRVL